MRIAAGICGWADRNCCGSKTDRRRDADGGLWFGTRTGGLYRWRSERLTHYTVAQGLASNSIYELVEDNKGKLWVSGPNGISVMNRRDLERVDVHSTYRVPVTLYGISEGLGTIQMCGGENRPGFSRRRARCGFPAAKDRCSCRRTNLRRRIPRLW